MWQRAQHSIQQYPWQWALGALALIQMGWGPLKVIGCGIMALVAWQQRSIPTLLVIATAPLYLIPVAISETGAIPLHEIVLLIVFPFWIVPAWQTRRQLWRTSDWWIVLLVLSAAISLLWVLPEGRGEALRTLRWMIVEPIVWLIMLRIARIQHTITPAQLTRTLLVTGGSVAFIGVLQFFGVDLAPLLGTKRAFSDNVVTTGNIRRVASVYGHANNLGLMLDRVWPWAVAALAMTHWRSRWHWGLVICVASGILVSFSRGAWLATAIASVLVGSVLFSDILRKHRVWVITAVVTGLALVAVLALASRGSSSGSIDARVLLWQESITWIQARPWGLGLGQFYFYHNPEYGYSIIDPQLIGTSEQYAAHPHNFVLDAWLNLGPIGVIALLAIVGTTLWRGFRGRWQLSVPLLAAITMLTTLIHGTIDQFFFVNDLVYFFWALVWLSQVDTTQSTSL